MSGPPGVDGQTDRLLPWTRALVVGGTSGIGEAIARQLASTGIRVSVIGRREERLQQIADDLNREGAEPLVLPFAHDVRETNEIPVLFQEIVDRLGGLDLVVYAPGVLPPIGPREFPTETDLNTIAVNLAGAVAWLNEAADRFGRAGRGTIVGISSVAGDRGRRGNPVYNASKAGLDTYLEALRARLAVRGVTIVTVKPGYVRTAMLENNPPGPLPVSDPEVVAAEILDAAAAGKRVVYIPGWWRIIMAVTRMIPAPIFERLSF